MSGILFDSPLTLEAALAEAARHEGNGRARTESAARRFAPDGRVGLRVFGEADLEAFLAIAWQEIDATRLLTPPDRARTIGAVARRLKDEFGSFGAIAASPGGLVWIRAGSRPVRASRRLGSTGAGTAHPGLCQPRRMSNAIARPRSCICTRGTTRLRFSHSCS